MGRVGIRYDLRSDSRSKGQASEALAMEPAERYARVLEHATVAEDCGVDVLWVAERPFVPGALLPAALPLCAALAERTKRIRIATGVLPLPLHHPLRVAEDAATVDVLSGGRFELGVGLGGHDEGFDGFGVPIRDRAGRLEEALDLILRAWTEETVGGSGGHFEISEVEVHPRPIQRPHPPLWIAAQAEAALRRAARLGTGLLTDSFDAARRFLAVWLELGKPGVEARIAWHLDPGEAEPDALAERIALGAEALAPARLDVVIPALSGGSSPDPGRERLGHMVAAIRSSFAG